MTHHPRVQKTRSRITGLCPKDAVEFNGVPNRFMDLKSQLRAIQNQGGHLRRTGLGRKKLASLFSHPLCVIWKDQMFDPLKTLGRKVSSKGVGIGSDLHLPSFDGGRGNAGTAT